MNRSGGGNGSNGSRGRKPNSRTGPGQEGRPSGRGAGNFRKKHFSRGNAPIEKPLASTSKPGGAMRLNKYISNAGVCSRREADTYISAGNVTVNGKVITEMGYQVLQGDEVRFDGRLLKAEKKEYILLNKPKNFITTTQDEKGRRTVMELISGASSSRVSPVGRLDRNTTGLLLFTNDGDLAKKLTHPKHGVRKIYHVEVNQAIKPSDLQKIRDGITLEDGHVKVDDVSFIEGASKREVGIQIHSGRNRIVRRIFEHLGYEVVKLDSVVFAGLTKKDLPRGHWRPLTKQEIINLGMIQ